MIAHRIFWPNLTNEQLTQKPVQQLAIIGKEAYHAIKVKRLTIGENVEVLNGSGLIAKCRVSDISNKKNLSLEIIESTINPQPHPLISIAAPPPKGPAADYMVNQLSQLGVTNWIPLQTRRTIVKPSENKIEKWQRIAVEAAKQCGRAWIMNIQKPLSLTALMNHNKYSNNSDPTTTSDFILVADINGDTPVSLLQKSLPPLATAQLKQITLLAGPEGGFSDEEYRSIISSGILPICLAPHILRLETAAVAGAAFCVMLSMYLNNSNK